MKMSSKCALAALALVGAASATSAGTVSFQPTAVNPSNFNGGEFLATFTNGAQPLRAFCLERQITFVPGTQYGYSFGNDAISGGGGSVGGSDPISAATAWIFTQWLSGNDFGETNPQERNILVQLAIWNLEQEGGSFSFNNGGLVVPLAQVTALVAQATGLYGSDDATQHPEFANIRALNPTSSNGTVEHQSMIVMIPLPTASGMALAGLALVGGIRRRK